jgi:hypothetical protein
MPILYEYDLFIWGETTVNNVSDSLSDTYSLQKK